MRGDRIEHHRRRAHRRDADQYERQLRVADAPAAQSGCERHRRRRAADRHRPAGEHAESGVEAEAPRGEDAGADRQHEDHHHREQGDRAEPDDLRHRHPRADQHDSPTQQRARGEAEAGGEAAIGREEVERQPKEQRHQRQRRAIMIRDEPRRERAEAHHEQAGNDLTPAMWLVRRHVPIKVRRHHRRHAASFPDRISRSADGAARRRRLRRSSRLS